MDNMKTQRNLLIPFAPDDFAIIITVRIDENFDGEVRVMHPLQYVLDKSRTKVDITVDIARSAEPKAKIKAQSPNQTESLIWDGRECLPLCIPIPPSGDAKLILAPENLRRETVDIFASARRCIRKLAVRT